MVAACVIVLGITSMVPAVLGLGPGAAWGVTAPETAEAEFAALMGRERSSRGLGQLVSAPDLVAVARRHAQHLAEQGRLEHNAALRTEVGNWKVVGENVGKGPAPEPIHAAFMESATHRAEILRAGYREVGVGVVWSGEVLWVAEVFREPLPARTAPTPRPRPVSSRTTSTAARASVPDGASAAPAPPPPAPPPLFTGNRREVPDLRPLVASGTLTLPIDPRQVPPEVAVAAGLLAVVIGGQALVMRRLGLI